MINLAAVLIAALVTTACPRDTKEPPLSKGDWRADQQQDNKRWGWKAKMRRRKAARRGEAPEDSPEAPAIERIAVPPDADPKAAEEIIRDLFKSEFSARTSEARSAFAAKLLEQGRATKDDPAGRYVFLREGGKMAVLAQDIGTALACLDETIRYYIVDGVDLELALLSKLYTGVRTMEAARQLADGYRALITEAMDSDLFDEADAAITKAQALARRIRDTGLTQELIRLDKLNAAMKKEYQNVMAAELKLSADVEDPEASLTVGRYYCLVKNDWDIGLELLANGSDPALKAVAEKELAEPTDPKEMAAIGNGWWDLAKREREPFRKEGYLRRAEKWYTTALPRLEGLSRLKVEKLLQELASDTTSKSRGGSTVNLLTWVDADGTDRTGGWVMQRGVLISPIHNTSPFPIPCIPPDEYDLEILVARKVGAGTIAFGLICEGAPVSFRFTDTNPDPNRNFYCSLPGFRDHLSYKGPTFSGTGPSKFVFSIRKNLLKVTHNNHVIMNWVNPPYGGKSKLKKGGESETLYLKNVGSQFEFSRIVLTPVSGGPPKRVTLPKK